MEKKPRKPRSDKGKSRKKTLIPNPIELPKPVKDSSIDEGYSMRNQDAL